MNKPGDKVRPSVAVTATSGGTRAPHITTHERHAVAHYQLARLTDELRPFKLHWFPTLGSTNSHAGKMRREKRLLAPAVVLTGHQTAGRGRGINVWHAPRGVITVTFVLSAHDTLPPQHVPLVAGLAVRDTVAALGASDIGIKWPNDLWHNDKKLAGLLCERIDGVDLIGVGLNASLKPADLPPALRKTTTSLHEIAGASIDITSLVAAVARNLRLALGDARTSLAGIRPRLQSCDVLKGRHVRVSQTGEGDVEGTAEGIDSAGRLLVRHRDGVTAVVNGTVRPV